MTDERGRTISEVRVHSPVIDVETRQKVIVPTRSTVENIQWLWLKDCTWTESEYEVSEESTKAEVENCTVVLMAGREKWKKPRAETSPR